MIKKAVFSYFNTDESFGNNCGFARYSDFLYTTSLAILCASRIFKEVQFISTDWGAEVFKEIGVPVTSYSNKLNEIKNISGYFWAYGKLLAYTEQDKPFVHVDNDVFLWEPLPKSILSAKLCFQSLEPFDQEGYHYYDELRECWDVAKVRPQAIVDNEIHDFAYNCGICGGSNLEIFKELRQCSAEYIFAEANQSLFFKKFRHMVKHQNLFHEQYFLASLIKKHELRDKVEVLSENAMDIPGKYAYTHLWGTTKTDRGMMARVRLRLLDEDRNLFDSIDAFCRKHKI